MAGFDFMSIALAVVGANASVAMLVVLGIAATYAGIWDKQGISDLGKLVFNMSMPALVFSKVLVQISVESLRDLWILPVFCVLHVFSAYLIMRLTNVIFFVHGAEAKATLACTMFGNCGSLAIAVTQALCQSDPLMTRMGGTSQCTARGVSYCAFYVIAWNILVWGLGDALLFPEDEAADKAEQNKPLLNAKPVEVEVKKTKVYRATSFIGQKKTKAEGPGRRFRSQSVSYTARNDSEKHYDVEVSQAALEEIVSRMPITGGLYVDKCVHRREAQETRITIAASKNWIISSFESAQKTFKQLSKSPPIRAAGLAMLLGLWPPLKALFVSADPKHTAPLGFVMVAMDQMGSAQVPVSMVMLSGSGTLRYLENLKASAKKQIEETEGVKLEAEGFHFSLRAQFLMLFGRLLIMPFVGYLFWKFFVDMEWFPAPATPGFRYGGGMLGFICLIEACVPSAQTIVTMFIVHGDIDQGGAIAVLILMQYALSIVFFSAAAAYFEFLTL